MADLISIIVPVYQSERYLKRCIDSILRQTYGRLEVILIDDGSKDHSLSICQEYAQRDPRVKVVHKENGGPGSARNAGFMEMTGDYLMLIDADDYIHPSMVAELLAAIHLDASDMAVCGFQMVFEDGREPEKHSIDTPFKGTLEEFINQQFIPLYDKLLINTQSNKMFSASLQREHEIFYEEDMVINEDTCISIRMLKHCRKVSCIQGDYLNYWQYSNPQSLVTRFNENGVDTCFTLLDAIKVCLSTVHVDAEVVNQVNNRMIFNICGFAGLAYYRSDWSNLRCYQEIRRLAKRTEFQKLVRETTPEGMKNRVAALVLRHGWCGLYHWMCLWVYRKQRKQYKRDLHE